MLDTTNRTTAAKAKLKIKVKHLAEEARIIRREAQNHRGALRHDLKQHKVLVVRPEARATQLVYAFLKGRTYEQVEGLAKSEPQWYRCIKMVERYALGEMQRFLEWMPDGAMKSHYQRKFG